MMLTRRDFLQHTAAGVAALGLGAVQEPNLEHTIATISGKPRERGRQYGSQFKEAIRGFLNREIYQSFTGKPNARESLVRYAAACGRAIKSYSPLLHDEMEGMAEGTGLALEEVVLVSNHEELWHRGLVPAMDHCTVFGSGGPD